MGGKEVYMGFPASVTPTVSVVKPDSQTKLPIEDNPTEAETAELSGDGKPEDDPGSPAFEEGVRKSLGAQAAGPRMESVRTRGGKSGPKDLAAQHGEAVAKNRTKVN